MPQVQVSAPTLCIDEFPWQWEHEIIQFRMDLSVNNFIITLNVSRAACKASEMDIDYRVKIDVLLNRF